MKAVLAAAPQHSGEIEFIIAQNGKIAQNISPQWRHRGAIKSISKHSAGICATGGGAFVGGGDFGGGSGDCGGIGAKPGGGDFGRGGTGT